MTDDMLEYSVHFIFGGAVSLMSWFFGGRDGFLMVLLTFMVIDQFSGLAAGWAEHKITSEAGFKGILKKCLILAFIGMAHLVDEYLFAHTVFGEHETARNVICVFYVGNEGISIIENADRLGIPILDFIRDRFLNMKKLNKKEGGFRIVNSYMTTFRTSLLRSAQSTAHNRRHSLQHTMRLLRFAA